MSRCSRYLEIKESLSSAADDKLFQSICNGGSMALLNICLAFRKMQRNPLVRICVWQQVYYALSLNL